MKIALLGKGKTGGKILEIAPKDIFIEVFDRSHPPTVENLAPFDVIISFLP
jgi:4-hydroxy-tetrahydrodipicolinate reductase